MRQQIEQSLNVRIIWCEMNHHKESRRQNDGEYEGNNQKAGKEMFVISHTPKILFDNCSHCCFHFASPFPFAVNAK